MLEMRGAYVVFALLAALDVLVLLRAAQHWRGEGGALDPDALLLASVLAALLLAVQGLLAWLFIRLRPATATLGAGMHRFEPPALAAFRAAAADDVSGPALEDAPLQRVGRQPCARGE